MRERAEHFLTAILLVILLPCGITLLLNGKMNEIYRAIQRQAQYISVRTGSGTREMNLEEYVIGVTAAEMPVDYEIEAIKAQMVLVRTNLWRKMQEEKDWNSAYISLAELELAGVGEKFRRAQKETEGKVLTWEGKPVMASYHALSAGKTRDARETLQMEDYPYLQSRSCPSDKKSSRYETTVQIDSSWKDLEILERDSAGYVLRMQLGDTVMSGEEFRITLGLASSNFRKEVNEDGVFLTTYGIGHGLGMSQFCAQQMALSGKNYKEILGYFFEGTSLESMENTY